VISAKFPIYLLLGSNQDDPLYQLSMAKVLLEGVNLSIINSSSIYESQAWGIQDQENFFNQVLQVKTGLSAEDLLDYCIDIENRMGRKREIKWQSRCIDIDILYYKESIINLNHLQVPHTELQNRKFTLVPLSELAPSFSHPKLNMSNKELLDICKDDSWVKKVT